METWQKLAGDTELCVCLIIDEFCTIQIKLHKAQIILKDKTE